MNGTHVIASQGLPQTNSIRLRSSRIHVANQMLLYALFYLQVPLFVDENSLFTDIEMEKENCFYDFKMQIMSE
jgi:hypothetical protein